MELIDKLSQIAEAIRDKTGRARLLTLDEMPSEIRSIQGDGTGGGVIIRRIASENVIGTDISCTLGEQGSTYFTMQDEIATKGETILYLSNVTQAKYLQVESLIRAYNTKISTQDDTEVQPIVVYGDIEQFSADVRYFNETQSNNVSKVGVSPTAKLYACKTFTLGDLTEVLSYYDNTTLKGMNFRLLEEIGG